LRRVWQGVQYRNVLPARAYLAAGLSLRDVASILSTTPEELDLQLWNSLGEPRA
jgi:thermostable 8-oxoguanine DNA glycosylase